MGIVDTSYRLTLDVDSAGLSYVGEVRVAFSTPTRKCRLNAVDLTVLSARAGGKEVPFTRRAETEELLVGPLPAGTREVTIGFQGKVSTDSLGGFYRSHHGEGGALLTTHLAPTGARRLFPCVDHPAAKAVFEVEVLTDPDLEVVFNTDPVEVASRMGRKVWRFQPTPKMSTYLLYLGIGRFDTLEEVRKGFRVAVRAPPGMRGSCAWALENGHRSVEAYAGYYGIPYPLPKLDLVSVHDFAAGAMENWGAITFRESYLLSDARTSTFLRQVIAEVVAHEIAHQWFGNLVTMKWWNDVWLNESFATFMSYKMVDRFYPDWDVFGQFLVTQTGPALQGDALASTHPIDVRVRSVEEIGQIFDDISYGKGASVLRMLEAFLGEQKFRRGVASYLRRHAYGSAQGIDLWKALERSSGAPVRRIIGPWVRRPGHPVVRAHLDGRLLHLRQQGFRLDGHHLPQVWPIPLALRSGRTTSRRLFDRRTLDLRAPPGSGALTLNAGSAGFYRVLYDTALYDRLRYDLDALAPLERWSLIRDLSSFLYSGDVPPTVYQGFVEALAAERSAMVVQETAGQALGLFALFGGDGPLMGSVRRFLTLQSERLGLSRRPSEPSSTGIAREVVHAARAYLDADFARTVGARFRMWGEVDADLRGAVAVGFARSEGASAFDPLVARAREAKNEGELEQVLGGLVAFRDPTLVHRALQWATSGEVTRGLLSTVGVSASRNPDARPVLWPWFVENLPTLEKVYGGTAMLTLMVERLLPGACLGRQAEVRRALADRPIPEAERGVRKGLEMLAVRESLRARLA